MRTSQYLLSTLREIPANTETISHQLMLRAGMIRKLASGLYTWLPTGLRVLRKIENIVREEMNNVGAMEILMPMIQPASLWQESGRWEHYGSDLLNLIDRSGRKFVLSPTHEEMITFLIRNELKSYKQLPLSFFQIQTKFRDELRPCFGVIRSREFLMKDAYSFHISQESLQETYSKMYHVYNRIFTRMGLNFRVVEADTGHIGGSISHEFQVLTKNKKNNTILYKDFNYINYNIELINLLAFLQIKNNMSLINNLMDTQIFTEIIAKQLKLLSIKETNKIFSERDMKYDSNQLITLLIYNNFKSKKTKIEKILQTTKLSNFIDKIKICATMNINSNEFTLINTPLSLINNRIIFMMKYLSIITNINNKYFFKNKKSNFLKKTNTKDTYNIINNNLNSENENILVNKKGIEIGHIFQLGNKYSKKINAVIQDENGYNKDIIMGCYGIGLTRLVAAVIEQSHDEHGVIWPHNDIAPFQVAIVPVNMYKSFCVQKFTEKIYIELCTNNIEVLVDDRKEHPGTMLNDMELIGIPHIIIVSDRNLNDNNIEYKSRHDGKKKLIKTNEILNFLTNTIKN